MSHVEGLSRGSPNYLRLNLEKENKWQPDAKSVFGLLLQNSWELVCKRDMDSLFEFLNRIMMPLVNLGLDVYLHIRDFYSLSPSSASSSYPILLVQQIRTALSNFETSSPVSLASIIIFEG